MKMWNLTFVTAWKEHQRSSIPVTSRNVLLTGERSDRVGRTEIDVVRTRPGC